jgi:hypothetical protein
MVLRFLIIAGMLLLGLLMGYFLGLHMHYPKQRDRSRHFKS